MPHPFRFAVQSYRAESRNAWVEIARKTEALGYSTLHVADHYIGAGRMLNPTKHKVQTLALIPAMTAAAMVTTTLRVGSRMACVGYHLPTILTKEMASIDVLSDGRLEIGLGAGWLTNEYEALGIPVDPIGKRLELLRETATFMKLAFTSTDEIDFHGEQIRSYGYIPVPQVIQKPHPPLMIGGGGPKVLRAAGELADIVSVNYNNSSGVLGHKSLTSSTPEETMRKIDWIREGSGSRFEEIELETAAMFVAVTGRSITSVEELGESTGMSESELRVFPHALVGSVEDICEQLIQRRQQYGFSYITVGESHIDAFAPIVDKLAGK